MIDKITNSWKLAKECWRVLMLDKEMLAFPALSTIVAIITFGIIALLIWPSSNPNPINGAHIDLTQIFNSTMYMKFAIATLIQAYIICVIMTFFNTGLVTCAFIRLSGGDPILKDGFTIALKRLPQILAWSLLAASVGLILRLFKGKNSAFRSILAGLLGLGWRVASFVAIPVIVAEGKGAIDALKRSGQIIKKNWGEALTLEIGFSVLAAPVLIPTFVLIGLSSSISASLPALSACLLVIAAIYTFMVVILFSTLDAIAKAALYKLSTGDHKLENFNNELLENTFKKNEKGEPALA